MEPTVNHRVLVVDDTPAIHDDIRKVLSGANDASRALGELEADLFGGAPVRARAAYHIDSAYPGQEAVDKIRCELNVGRRYEVAFVDVRMPPGWDGIETIEQIWKIDPNVQVVICTAYSDHAWPEIVARLGHSDQLLILKKPFDIVEVNQLAHALGEKWALARANHDHVEKLTEIVRERTAALEAANGQLKKEHAQRQTIELELRLAQKLEAVGQLAAGIAHEVNTPIQYVSDSVQFLQTAFGDLTALVGRYKTLLHSTAEEHALPALHAELDEAETTADLVYLEDQIPKAFDRVFEGTTRVTTIVRAMKEFAHSDSRQMAPADLNRALHSTLIVASNEYKYVADIRLDLAELPAVTCHIGDLNQVFLNLIVNAAHAIEDVVGESGSRGNIGVKTSLDGGEVLIAISDDGTGIPATVQPRIFDPFFTTKEVGRGSGQGLAIARTIVIEKHGGTLTFDTAPGRGTTFNIRLPIDRIAQAAL